MFQNVPPTDTASPLPIIRCRPKRPLEVVVCSRELRGLPTHHLNGVTFICSGVESCPGCQRNHSPRWQGFFVVRSNRDQNYAILQFTPIAGKILCLSKCPKNGLLGLRVRFNRLGTNVNSPLNAHVMGREHGVQEFSAECLEKCLRRIFIRLGPNGKLDE